MTKWRKNKIKEIRSRDQIRQISQIEISRLDAARINLRKLYQNKINRKQ